MWISAEIVNKEKVGTGYRITVRYSTDDVEPSKYTGFVTLSPGQDDSTLKGAIIQQLADLNAEDAAYLKNKVQSDTLTAVVDAILLGIVDTSTKET